MILHGKVPSLHTYKRIERIICKCGNKYSDYLHLRSFDVRSFWSIFLISVPSISRFSSRLFPGLLDFDIWSAFDIRLFVRSFKFKFFLVRFLFSRRDLQAT